MQVLYYVKNKNLGCLAVYGITYLVASKYSKKLLHVLLLSSLISLIIFDCNYTLEEGMVNALCSDNLTPGVLKGKTLIELKKHKKQCSEQKKTLENDIAITAMNASKKKQKQEQVKNLEKKIRFIDEEISNKNTAAQKAKKTP